MTFRAGGGDVKKAARLGSRKGVNNHAAIFRAFTADRKGSPLHHENLTGVHIYGFDFLGLRTLSLRRRLHD